MFRYKDLYDHVLFNYQWLYAKMCAVPLPEVLGTEEYFFVQIYYVKNVVKGSVSRDRMTTVKKTVLLEVSAKNLM
jgi:hypothetical protein